MLAHMNHFTGLLQLLAFSLPLLYCGLLECQLLLSSFQVALSCCYLLILHSDILQHLCIKFLYCFTSTFCSDWSSCSLVFSTCRCSTFMHTALSSIVAASSLNMVLEVTVFVLTWRCEIPGQATKCTALSTEHN